LAQAIDDVLRERVERLERVAVARVLRDAHWILDDRGELLARLARELARSAQRSAENGDTRLLAAARRLERSSPSQQLARRATRLEVAASRLPSAAARVIDRATQRCALDEGRLKALSPLRVLERGYTLTRVHGARAPLESADALRAGDELETVFARGRTLSKITAVDSSSALTKPAPGA
jgi:exodeoxyribonuclease VII large subunit